MKIKELGNNIDRVFDELNPILNQSWHDPRFEPCFFKTIHNSVLQFFPKSSLISESCSIIWQRLLQLHFIIYKIEIEQLKQIHDKETFWKKNTIPPVIFFILLYASK